MNSNEFRQAAATTFALAMDAYQAVINSSDATMEEFVAADAARIAADAVWIAAQHTANTMAQAELNAATAKGCAEVVEEVTAEAFSTAWGIDGAVLTATETADAVKAGQGWFDAQGRWVNMARMNAQASR